MREIQPWPSRDTARPDTTQTQTQQAQADQSSSDTTDEAENSASDPDNIQEGGGNQVADRQPDVPGAAENGD